MKPILPIALLGMLTQAQAQFYTTVETYAGDGTAALLDGPLATARFDKPYSVCYDPLTGTIYVADAFNNAIRKINGGIVTTLAGNGLAGDVDAQGTNARFYVPTGIDYRDGYVYVSDNGNHKIKRIDAAGNVTTFAGTGTVGTNDGPVGSARFNNPTEVRVRSDGVVFVSDYQNHSIRKIESGMVTTFAGLTGISGDALGIGTAARFNKPTGIAFGSSGYLFVADQVNCKIKAISPSGEVTFIAGSGATASVDGVGASASFCRPTYVGWDPFGALMVADWMGNVIRRVLSDGTVTTVAGNGVAGYYDGLAMDAMFDAPYGICVDILGNAYIGDKYNNVVRVLNKLGGGVDVHEMIPTSEIPVYPNPTVDELFIDLPDPTANIDRVLVTDALGRIVMDHGHGGFTVQRDVLHLSVRFLASGRYGVVLMADNAPLYRTAFVR